LVVGRWALALAVMRRGRGQERWKHTSDAKTRMFSRWFRHGLKSCPSRPASKRAFGMRPGPWLKAVLFSCLRRALPLRSGQALLARRARASEWQWGGKGARSGAQTRCI